MAPVHPDVSPLPPGAPAAPRRRALVRTTVAAVLAGALLAACGQDDGPITDVRDRPATLPRAPAMSTRDRFAPDREDPHAGGAREGDGAPGSAWDFDVPAGWTALPPAPMRDAGFRVDAHPDTECTLARAGGTLEMNLNRWRGQMGLAPADAAALAALPREPFLGTEGVLVEVEGTFQGMGKQIAGAKLLGLVASGPNASVFVKMVGPTAAVDAEKERFLAFARSVRRAAPSGMPAGHPPVGDTEPAAAADGPLRWTAPAGWVEGPARAMRVVTLVPQGARATECAVFVLGGAAGGTVANVNRWREQMGLPPVDRAAIDALPRIPSIGAQGVFVELAGALDDPMRGVQEKDGLLYGLVVERGSDTVFVKMTGPASEMRPQRAAFEAFCRSLEAAR